MADAGPQPAAPATRLDDTLKAIATLLASIDDDDNRHGGLLSRETIRAADEVRCRLSQSDAVRDLGADLDRREPDGRAAASEHAL